MVSVIEGFHCRCTVNILEYTGGMDILIVQLRYPECTVFELILVRCIVNILGVAWDAKLIYWGYPDRPGFDLKSFEVIKIIKMHAACFWKGSIRREWRYRCITCVASFPGYLLTKQWDRELKNEVAHITAYSEFTRLYGVMWGDGIKIQEPGTGTETALEQEYSGEGSIGSSKFISLEIKCSWFGVVFFLGSLPLAFRSSLVALRAT